MKITCAINERQAEKLYKTIYKSLSTALEAGETFDANAYMADLFDKIADVKDEDTAIKFLQQVPSIIRSIAAKPAFDKLDVKLDPIKDLAVNFKDLDKGFDNVLEYFKPQMTERSKIALLRASEIEGSKGKEVEPPTEIKDPVRLRPSSAGTATMQQLIPINPTQKQIVLEERVDKGKQRIYTALEKIRNNIDLSEVALTDTITYQGQKLKLKPILLSKLAETHADQLDIETRKNLVERSAAIKNRGLTPQGVETANTIALVLSDESGNYHYFDEEGNITSEEKGGGIVYQFARNVKKTGNKYEMTNAYGYANTLQTPSDIASQYGITVEEATKMQQEELAQLYELRNQAIKGDAPLLDLVGLSPGVRESIAQKVITLQNLREFPFVNNATFRSIKPVMTPGGDVSAVIELNGQEYGLDRPNLTDDLIDKISSVLSDPNISNLKKYEFINQFLSDNASPSTRRHKINYNPGTDTLLFSYTEKTYAEGSGKTIPLTNEELNGKKDIFVDVLTNASKAKNGKFYTAKMSYNSEALGRNGYLDYSNGQIGEIYTPYLPLLETLPNTRIMMSQQTDPGFFNSYMEFTLPSKFNTEFDESLNNPNVNLEEEPISDLVYNAFLNTGTVSDKILNDIIDAGIKKQPLSPRQEKIKEASGSAILDLVSKRLSSGKPIPQIKFDVNNIEVSGIIYGHEHIFGKKELGDIRSDIPYYTKDNGIGIIEKKGNKYAVAWSSYGLDGVAIRETGGSTQRPGWIAASVKLNENSTLEQTEAAKQEAKQALMTILPTIKNGTINKSDIVKTLSKDAQKAKIDNVIDPKDTNNPSIGGSASLFDFDRKGVDLGSITEQDIKNAQDWWGNSPLSKYIDFKTMVNIVNSDVYAKFIAYGAKLNEKFGEIQIGERGTLVDVYHEAWHAFSQIFLTPEERTKLYNEVAKQEGSFTLLDGTTVKFSEASYLQLEEYLAEDFRSYAINQGTKKGSPVRNSIFRRIANFLKDLFRTKSTKETLFNNLYFADKNKNFLNKYSPIADTYSFTTLNKGIESLEDPTIDALSRQDSNLVSNSIDSYLSDIVDYYSKDKKNKGIALRILIGEQNKNAVYTQVKKDFQEKLSDANSKYELVKNDPDKIMEAEKLQNQIRIFTAALKNFGSSKEGVIKYHTENSAFDILRGKFKEVTTQEQELEEDGESNEPTNEDVKNTDFDKKVGKESLLDSSSNETRYLLSSLHKIENGKPVVNELGYKVLADFGTTWNNLMRAVGGEKNPEKIYNKVKQAGETIYPEFKQLIATKLPDPNSMSNVYQAKLATNFWQDVQRTRATYLQTTIFDNGIAEVTKASIETLSLIKKFEAKFKSDLNSKYIERSNNVALLNLKKVVSDFGTSGILDASKSFEFARAIGLYLDDMKIIKEELNKNQKAKELYGLPYIYRILSDLNNLNEASNTRADIRNEITKLRLNPIEALTKGMPAGILSSKPINQKNTIEKIVSLQAKYGFDSANFAVLNAERNLVFEHIDDHTVSMVLYGLNQANSMKDFWTKGSELEFMSYLEPSKNSFTTRLQTLNTLFDFNDDYAKRDGKSLQMIINSGTQVEANNSGTNTTSLDARGKFLQEINSMLKGGLIEFMRHASKKASFAARVEGGIIGGVGKGTDSRLWVDTDKFATGTAMEYATRVHMIPYLAGELERINKFRSNPKFFEKFTGYNRPMSNGTVAGENFTAFDNVLTKDTKNDILNAVTDPNVRLEDYLKTDPVLKRKIEEDIDSYFKQVTEDTLAFYEEGKYMSPDLLNKNKLFNLSPEESERAMIKAFVVNSWIQNFENATLFYGDIAQYNHEKEELHKRISGSTSGGLKIRTDKGMQKFLTDLNANTSYAATIPGMETLVYTGKYNTAIIKDIKRTSKYLEPIREGLTKDYTEKFSKFLPADKVEAEVKRRVDIEIAKYKGMEEGDGQGWITFDAYRSLKIASGQWSDLQESLYKKVINNEPISKADIVEMFPVYKLQNFGHLANTDIPVMAMHKFALAPLIPTMIEGSDLQSLHEQMMKDNIQYVTFQSGSKVGSVTSDGSADVIYDNEDQNVIKSNIKFTPNTIYLEYLKDVTKVPVKFKEKTVFATQLRKLILSNLYEGGELIDKFKKHAGTIKAYEKAVDDYGDLLKTELLNEIGYEYNETTGKYTGNIQNFVSLIQKELGRKNLPEHHIEFVNMNLDKTLKTDLSLHLKSDDIEKILVSLIEKRLIRQKIKGEALVQVSSAMTNGMWSTPKFQNATDEEIRKFIGTNNLPFYNSSKNGTSAMKVAIALQGDFTKLYNLKYKGERIGNLARLNEAIKDEEWLDTDNNRKSVTLTSVRIPVQGLNSMEFMEVYEFLDPSASNLIILPSEIVAKSGSDFDVDKLTTFMPALDKSGKFIESALTNEALKRLLSQNKSTEEGQEMNQRIIETQKQALENRLITTINDILKLPENYASLVRPNDTYLLKDDLADKLEDSVSEFNRFQNYHGETERPGKKTKRSISPTRTLEPLYNLHKHEANMIGKDVLGLVAIYNALHPVFNSIGAAMPASYKNSVYDPSTNTYVEGTKDLATRLFLPHNKTKDGRISLSGTQTQDGDIISDLFSQLINGAVDVEKDAWIFFIQGNMETIPILAMLLKAGVPKEHAVKFLSQPMIREYTKQQRLYGSSYANLIEGTDKSKDSVKTKAAKNVLARFGVTTPNAFLKGNNYHAAITKLTEKSGILNKDGHFDIKILDKILEDPGNPAYDNHQLAMFMHFIEMEKQFSGMQDLIRLANPDTTTSKTIQEVIRRNVAMDEMLSNSKVDPKLVEALRKESILGTFYDNQIISDLIEPLFKLKDNKFISDTIVSLIKNKKRAIKRAFGTSKNAAPQFISQFKNGIVNSIYQNYMRNYVESGNDVLNIPTELLSKYFTDNIFFRGSSMSFADDIMNLIDKHPQLKERYNVLQQLSMPTLPGGEKILTLNDQKLLSKGTIAEQYYENLQALSDPNVEKVKDTEENRYISNMFKVLPLVALYQNGVGYSKYGFNEILPFGDFVTIMDKASNDFLKNEMTTDKMLEIFDTTVNSIDRNFKNFLSGTQPTVSTQQQGSVIPKGKMVKEGIYVNEGALTKDEQLELFNYLKPFLEEQAAKTNKGVAASKMIGLGLRWDYKSNNPGKQSVDIPDVINPGNRTKYGYYNQSINGQPLGQITSRFRELMQKATGIDMTNYDGAIINLYEPTTFISSHNDVDESRSAIGYPVIGINIGGTGNFSIESRDGDPKQLDLKPGSAYVFGVDGVNREVYHRTFPKPQDSFLPKLTTKIDGKTYDPGSYRITVTMRRVMPLESGMPTTPAKINTQQQGGKLGPQNISSDVIKEGTQLDLFDKPLTFGGKSIAEQLQILNTPEFKGWFAQETIKNPNLDASEALDYYIKCKGL